MNKKKIYQTLFFLLTTLFFASGCVINIAGNKKTPAAAPEYGGFFRSQDLGLSWIKNSKIYNIQGKMIEFNSANLTTLSFDPNDAKTMYLGTAAEGILYSYNYGDGWYSTVPGKGKINDIAVDYRDKCTVYAAIFNAIYKSTDCSRNWKMVYFEDLPNIYITSLAMSPSNNALVYAGTNSGSFLVSRDYGQTYTVTHRFNNPIISIVAKKGLPSNRVYAVTTNAGIFSTDDDGANFSNLFELEFDEAEIQEENYRRVMDVDHSILAFAEDKSVVDGLIFVSQFGIFRLTDGARWQQIKLLTPKNQDTIYAVEVNPKNAKEIFYGTNSAFYHSVDGGLNWEINKLPNNSWARFIKFSPDNKYLYLGTFNTPQ